MDKGARELSGSKEYLETLAEFRRVSLEASKVWFWRTYFAGIAWVVLVVTTLMLGCWPVSQVYIQAKLSEFKAVKLSIELARKEHPPSHDAEMRGIQVLIAQWNGWLAYWKEIDNVPGFEFYVPDEIKNIETIK